MPLKPIANMTTTLRSNYSTLPPDPIFLQGAIILSLTLFLVNGINGIISYLIRGDRTLQAGFFVD